MVEFVSYTGEYPNLCRGILTLKIDNKEVTFGSTYNGNDYDSFWYSGGNCGFINNYTESYVNHSKWEYDEDYLPKEFRQYKDEIMDCFNANVPYGCCGGCL